jgi:hypothetical protein
MANKNYSASEYFTNLAEQQKNKNKPEPKAKPTDKGIRGEVGLLKSILPKIANDLSFIKKSISSIVKSQETEKRAAYFERQKRRAEEYGARYKKEKPAREKAAIKSEQKSFLEQVKEILSGILKFALMGLAALGIDKLLNFAGVTTGIQDALKKIILTISDLIQKGVEILAPMMRDPQIIGSITELVKKVFMFIADGISTSADVFKRIITDPENKDSIGKVIVAVISTIFKGLLSAIDIGSRLLSENADSIKEGIVTVFVKIAEAIAGGLKFAESLLKDPSFAQAVANIFYAVKSFIKTIWETPIQTPIGSVTIGGVLTTLGAAMLAFEATMAGVTAYLLGKGIGSVVNKGRNVPAGPGGKNMGSKSGAGNIAGTALDVITKPGTALALTGTAMAVNYMRSKGDSDEALKQAQSYTPATSSSPVKSEQKASTAPIQSSSQTYYGENSGTAIRDVIGKSEGGKSGYNATYGYGYGKQDPLIEKLFGAGRKLTDLSINEVLHYTNQRGGNQGAVGKYQFMPDVLRGLVSKASGYGIHFESKFTPQVQDTLYSIFSQKNVDFLKAKGIPITPENIHLAHSVGAAGAVKLLTHKDQNANIQQVLGLKGAAAKTNPHLNVPIWQYREQLAAKYGGTGGTTLASGRSMTSPVAATTNVTPTTTGDSSTFTGMAGSSTPTMAAASTPSMQQDVNESPVGGETKTPVNSAMNSIMSTLASGYESLDKATGGRLGMLSGDLQAILRDKSFLTALQTPEFNDLSKNINSTDNVAQNQKTPSVYDEVLLSKLSKSFSII